MAQEVGAPWVHTVCAALAHGVARTAAAGAAGPVWEAPRRAAHTGPDAVEELAPTARHPVFLSAPPAVIPELWADAASLWLRSRANSRSSLASRGGRSPSFPGHQPW